MLWETRCKYCDVKVGVNSLKGLIANLLIYTLLIFGVFYSFEHYGLISIAVAIVIYMLISICFEMFGPLVVRGSSRELKE